MFYYKTETEHGTQWEERNCKITNLPDNMTEITEEEYNAAIAEIEKKWAEEEENRPINPYAAITSEEANEAIREGVNAV